MAELKKIYKEMEFYSLLKELGPTEDAHTRDYATISDRDEAVRVCAKPWRSSILASRSRSRFNRRWKAIYR